ncbi:MAG: transcription antitermination factor NusB [Clostridiales bacterium]|nr:transcription antitermination factor NusB [Clostridiales bacterium]
MTRREMREHCFKMLFGVGFYPEEETEGQVEQYFLSPEEEDAGENGAVQIVHQVGMPDADRAFLTDRVERIAALFHELDDGINGAAQGWSTRRMGRVELTILRQALYEMRYDDDVPEKVAINEAVDLAKKFGGKDSPAFVNGVLARLVKE